jgi:integrase
MLPGLCKGAGIKLFTLHVVRRYARSDLLYKRHRIKEIHFLLGHEKAATTETYLNIQTGNFHDIVNSLSEKTLRSITVKPKRS